MMFSVKKEFGFGVFLVHPTVVSVLLSASVERCFVSCMRDFYSGGWSIIDRQEKEEETIISNIEL